MTRMFLFLMFFVAFVACGQNDHSYKRPQDENKNLGRLSNDIKTRWNLTSKSCNGLSLAAQPSEEYRFDDSHFVRVETSESDGLRCVTAYVYNRLIATSSFSRNVLNEQGTLLGSQAKRKCYHESNSSAAPEEEVIKFGPEELSYSLSSDSERITIVIQSGQDCTAGPLTLELTKSNG